jgi:predicted Zn-dependent protease
LDESAAVAREYADLLMERRRYRKAETYYRKAHELGLRDDRLLLGLGGALAASGKTKEAVPLLEDVYGRQPSERLAYELARLYKKLGRNDRALELLAEIERSQRTR